MMRLRIFVITGIVFLAFMPIGNAKGTESDLSFKKLTCEYETNPRAIDKPQPHLGWVLESDVRGQRQTAYQILVADSETRLRKQIGNLWDSGKIESGESVSIPYAGKSLSSGQRGYWKVRVWDRNDQVSGWSAPASWEMALLAPNDWTGAWLSDGKKAPETDAEFYQPDPAPLFRKEFHPGKKVTRARLYITAAGYYEASLNGARVGDAVLDPGWTDYRQRILYSTYDVTEQLRAGSNCLGVMLGNGWYNSLPLRMWGRYNLRDALATGRPCFIAQLNLEFADGSRASIVSDSTWKFCPGPVIRNNIYLGEVYDARLEIPGWNRPGFADTGWKPAVLAPAPGGKLVAQHQPPIKITATLKPVQRTEPKPGVFIFDFGQNFSGWVRLKIQAEKGTQVTLRYGELLNADGTLNPMTSVCGQIKGRRQDSTLIGGSGAPEIAWQQDVYLCGGRKEIYTPRFTFHGFRFVEITGMNLPPDALEGLRLNSAVEKAGAFACSSELINQIQKMTEWTFLSNIFSVQSDCPHRERFGYGGDVAVTSAAFMFNFQMPQFYAKTLRDFHDAALPDGMLTDTAPFVGIQYCGVGWALAHPLLLQQLHQIYGFREIVMEQYPTARRWFELVAAQNPEHIVPEGLSDHEGLEPKPSPPMVTPLYFLSARLLAELAEIADLPADTQKYTQLAEKIQQAYLSQFLEQGAGKVAPNTQASQAIALYLDLLPEREHPAALQALVEKIQEKNNHLATGIFGTRFLPDVLCRLGAAELAWEIVTQPTFPGWGHTIANGATTLWEHWEFSDNTFSHNHPMFGSVSEWFYKWLAGIQPLPGSVGFDTFRVRPQPVGDLKWVRADYESVRGKISSHWERTGDHFRLSVTVPVNATAQIFLPAREIESITESGRPLQIVPEVQLIQFENHTGVLAVGSGTYVFDAKF